jgi:glycerol-3-phosphate dehydrogenase
VLALAEADPSLREPLVAGLPYLKAEAVFGVRHEMARSVDDILSRRTRARLLARDASAAAADDVATLIGPLLGWSATEASANAADYRRMVEVERASAELPETALDASLGA